MADPILFNPGQTVAPPDWDAMTRQHGGNLTPGQPIPLTDPELQKLIIANPSLASHFQQHPAYRYYMADGSYVTAFGLENGQDVQIVDYKPSAKFTRTQTGTGTAPPGGKAYIDEEGPTGRRLGWNPGTRSYDRDLGSSPSAQAAAAGASDTKPLEGYPGWSVRVTKVGNETRTEFLNPQGQVAQDPRPAADQPAQVEQPVDGRPGWTRVTIKQGNSQVTAYRNPDGQIVSSLPADPADVKTSAQVVTGSDGKQYVQHTRAEPGKDPEIWHTDLQGNRATLPDARPPSSTRYNPDTGEYEEITRDAQGNTIVRPVRREGQTGTRAAGPSFPQIVFGQSEEALRTYADQLNAAVAAGTMTPGERKQRLSEALETAGAVINEAQITSANERANLSAGANLATTRYTQGMRGIETALDVAQNIARYGKPGSSAGGQAFAAILGIQQYQRQQSGIDQVPMLGAGRGAAALSPPPGPGSPSGPAQSPSGPSGIPAPTQSATGYPSGGPNALGLGAIGTVPAPGGAPAPPALSQTTGPLPAAQGLPVSASAAAPRPWTDITTGPSVLPSTPPLPPGAPGGPPIGTTYPVMPNPSGGAGAPPAPMPAVAAPSTPAPMPTVAAPSAPAPMPSITPAVPNRAVPGGPLEEGTWPPIFSPQPGNVTNAATPPGTPSRYGESGDLQGLVPGPAMLPAVAYAEAAARSPLDLTEDDYLRYKRLGIPDDVILAFPGRSA